MNANANKAPFKQGFRIEINHILFFLILPHKGHLNKKKKAKDMRRTQQKLLVLLRLQFIPLWSCLCMHAYTSKQRESEKKT